MVYSGPQEFIITEIVCITKSHYLVLFYSTR